MRIFLIESPQEEPKIRRLGSLENVTGSKGRFATEGQGDNSQLFVRLIFARKSATPWRAKAGVESARPN